MGYDGIRLKDDTSCEIGKLTERQFQSKEAKQQTHEENYISLG